MKFLIDFTGDVLHKVTNILPEGFGVRKYFDGLVDSVKGLAHVANEPDAAGRFIGGWVKNVSDLTGKIITGKFNEIDWIQAAKDSQLSLILTAVNPLLGAVTSTAIAGTDLILQATDNSKDGDNKVELQDVLGVVQSSLGMIGEVKNVIGNNISKVAEISPNDAQTMQEVYGELGELENSTYKYEKLVNAELYEDAAKEMGKIQTFTQKFINRFNIGTPTGGASDIGNTSPVVLTGGVEYNTKPKAPDFVKNNIDIDDAIYKMVLENINNRSFDSTKGMNNIVAILPKSQMNMPKFSDRVNIPPHKNNLVNNIQFEPTNQNYRAQNTQKINDLLKLLNTAPNSYNKSQTDYSKIFENNTLLQNNNKINNSSKQEILSDIKEIDFNPKNELHLKADKFKVLSVKSNEYIKKAINGQNSIGEDLNGWKVKQVEFDPETNFKAVVFEKDNEMVISFVGTDFSNIKDNIANIKMALTGRNKQMKRANDLCDKIKKANIDKNITLIGHSEGGSEAIYAGANNGFPVIAYNAFEVSKKVLPKDLNADISHFRNSNDIVSIPKRTEGIDRYILDRNKSILTRYSPLEIKNAHQLEQMGDLKQAIPEQQYKLEHPSFINIKNMKKIQPELLQRFNQKSQNRALEIMEANHVFDYNLSEEDLFNIYIRLILS